MNIDIETLTIAAIFYTAKAVGYAAILAGLLWLLEKLAIYIIKCLGAWQILIEFAWERSKKKHENKNP